MTHNTQLSVSQVTAAARGRWPVVLSALGINIPGNTTTALVRIAAAKTVSGLTIKTIAGHGFVITAVTVTGLT